MDAGTLAAGPGLQVVHDGVPGVEFVRESACQNGKAETAVELATNIREFAASALHAMVRHFSVTT